MAPETLDTIVDFLANGDFCAQNGDERCPAAVDGVIRQISSDFLLSKDKVQHQHDQADLFRFLAVKRQSPTST